MQTRERWNRIVHFGPLNLKYDGDNPLGYGRNMLHTKAHIYAHVTCMYTCIEIFRKGIRGHTLVTLPASEDDKWKEIKE